MAFTTLLSSTSLTGVQANQNDLSKKAACRIEIDNPHISKSILRKEKRSAVKVNARSICDAYQTRVELTVEIYQVGLFRDYKRASFTTIPSQIASNGFIVNNKNTKWYCQSKKRSRFYGVAYSRAFIGSQQFAAPPARSHKTVLLACGIWVRLFACRINKGNSPTRVMAMKLLTNDVEIYLLLIFQDINCRLKNFWRKVDLRANWMAISSPTRWRIMNVHSQLLCHLSWRCSNKPQRTFIGESPKN